MKESLIRYTCDYCKNTITVNKDCNYCDTPLHVNWLRIYRLMDINDKHKTKLHFCRDLCALSFIQEKC